MQKHSEWDFLKSSSGDYFYIPVPYAESGITTLSETLIHRISNENREPDWLHEMRLSSFSFFCKKNQVSKEYQEEDWSPDFDRFTYYRRLEESVSSTWNTLSDPVRQTLERLNLRDEENAFLGGLKAQVDSDIVYSSIKREFSDLGVVFVDSISGLRDYPDLFKKWFSSLVSYSENRITALNTALFTGGAFLYVPPAVKLEIPLKSYFRLNDAACAQFGRTLIVADRDSEVTFMEGCSAAEHGIESLHASIGEVIALEGAKVQFITMQNWSRDVLNLVCSRARAYDRAQVKWLDCNIGSKYTRKYPTTELVGHGSRAEIVSIGFAGEGQHQDTGGNMIHQANATGSSIRSKSISIGEGRATYRGLVQVDPGSNNCRNNTECDALLIDANCRTDTYPAIVVSGGENAVQHEASISKISREQIFYMQQRGFSEEEAVSLSINGFINNLVQEFPMQYSLMLKQLIDLEMTGSVG